ncbi:MAG: hypothetical protein ACREID_08895, partial [Planctomycetota bacterium]
VKDAGAGRLLRAYRFVATPWRLVLRAREEAREMEAMVVSRVVPLEDRLRVEALVNFYVRRGLVDTLSFVVPVADEGEALLNAPDLREERSEAVEGGRRYTLTLRTPTRGSASAAVTYHVPYDRPVRGVEPLHAPRVRRYVAVEKAPDGEVRVGPVENLDPGVFDDLPLRPPETTAQTVARVFVGSGGPFALAVAVKRHSFEEVARAVVHRAAAQAVVDRSGWTRVLVSYRVYNRAEQFLRLELPGKARLYSVFVAGEGVRPLGQGYLLLVPLRKVAIGAPTFDVDVVYAYRGDILGDADLPVLLPRIDGLDVRRTTLSLYLPKGYDYDFDTGMERVRESDITVEEAGDVYREIKELYGVAERGNVWQAQRALENCAVLEREVLRLRDKAVQNAAGADKLQQLETQIDAIASLKRATEGQKGEQTFVTFSAVQTREGRKVDEWGVNEANLRRVVREEAEQLKDFARKQTARGEGAYKGPQGAAPATAHEPSGPHDARQTADAGGAQTPEELIEASNLDQGESVLAPPADKAAFFGGAAGEAVEAGRRDSVTSFGFTQIGDLTAAKGRISIRIDLPLEGEVVHFARLAAHGGVSVRASEADGSLWETLVALLCAAGAGLALRKS